MSQIALVRQNDVQAKKEDRKNITGKRNRAYNGVINVSWTCPV
jgi:hypothetical protein